MPEGLLLAKSKASVRALEKAVENELLNRAKAQGIEDPIIRDLEPSDLNGVSGEFWVETCTAGAYSTVFSGKLTSPDQIVAIYGIGDGYATNASAAVGVGGAVGGNRSIPPGRTLRFGVGAGPTKIKDIWNIDRMRGMGKQVAFAGKPIIYDKDDQYNIEARGNISVADNIVLYGKICEARGVNITG